MIVARPAEGERQVLDACELSPEVGLVGDNWLPRGSSKTEDGSADPLRQLTVMSSRAIVAIAGDDPALWPPAGDQFFVDLDLSVEHLPPGTRLKLGTAVIEVTEPPHTGCKKFTERYGSAATRWVNTPEGRQLRLRGLNARVVTAGRVDVGQTVLRLA